MKCISVLLLAAAAGFAADVDFATGQAARLIIGQTQATRGEPGATEKLLGGVSGVAYANDTLFVADSNRVSSEPINNRVLIFRNVSGSLPRPTDELPYTQRCPICVGQADTVLGQPDFEKTEWGRSQSGLRLPTAVASDGNILVVADTDNNRVLIWNTIPASNNQPANVVVGQPDFTTATIPQVPTSTSMRGPQGVWIHGGKLYVADTQNHRVLIYNRIPTTNGAAADVVLGQPNFTTFVEPDLTQQKETAQANNMLNPVSVTSDGQRLYVTDLGYNRVLIWNSIPQTNQAPADVVIGQPDLNSSLPNNSFKIENDKQVGVLCPAAGQDADGNDVFPARCDATLSFPRFALSDGNQLFIADGGNDRVLVYKTIPTSNGQPATYVIGQLGGGINQASDAADSMRTPMSLAWDGLNLYVSDTFNRRINVYSMGEHSIPYTGVRNAASFEIYAVGGISFSGEVTEGDSITVKIGEKEYTYKFGADDGPEQVVTGIVETINAGEGDPLVFATANLVTGSVVLTSRVPGSDGNAIEYSATASNNATVLPATLGATLAGGMDAAKIAPGTIVSIVGENLADGIAAAPPGAALPDELAGVQVYFDGVRSPLMYVSPTQINAQVPFEFLDTTSISAYVRTQRADGNVSVTTPVAVSIVPENPGIFTQGGAQDPRPAVALHYSSNATGSVHVDGSANAGDIATITIEDREYTYTVKEGDTLASIRDGLIELINNQDPRVRAFAAGVWARIRLEARVAGPDGNGIPFTASAPEGAGVILSPTNVALCCANVAGAPITQDNPAVPGETVVIYATGLGLPNPTDMVSTGEAWPDGGPRHEPREPVSSLAGAKTANVLYAALKPGMVGVWEVHLQLNSDLPTNPATQMTIAQFEFVSNIVTFPLVNPNPPVEEEPIE